MRTRSDPVEHAVGRGPAPLYPARVPLASELRPAELMAVPGTGLAAASGEGSTGPALQLIDIDAARVVWTDTTACMGRLVHATTTRLVCASGRGVVAIDVATGTPSWRSERAFRTARDDRMLVAGALVDVATGSVVREVPSGPVTDHIAAVCADGMFAVVPTGALSRLDDDLTPMWDVALGAVPSALDACRDPVLVEIPRPGRAERALVAVSRDSGAVVGRPIDVLGWWPERGAGAGVETATVDGLQRRAPDLSAPVDIVDVRVGGRLLASRGDVRLVRAVAGSLIALGPDGFSGWLGAPRAPRRAVLGDRRVLAAGWLGPLDTAQRLTLWELPTAAAKWPVRALRPPAPVTAADVVSVRIPPAPTPWDASATVVADGVGGRGVSDIALSGHRVFAAHHSARPGPGRGGDVSAFDLRTRLWLWHQDAGCADAETIVELVATERQVICATRRSDGAGTIVAVDADTGAPAWRALVPAVSRVRAGSRHVGIASGAQWRVVDGTGAVVRSGASGDGHVARFELVGERFAVVEAGAIVGHGADAWRTRVDGFVVDLVATTEQLFAYTATGQLVAIDPSTGAPQLVPGWSPTWRVPTAGDLMVDFPDGPDPFVLRTQRFAVGLPHAMEISPNRLGTAAPLMLVDRTRAVRIIGLDSGSGAIQSVHTWPRRAAQRGVFSAVVDGAAVKGVVLSGPLAVVLL